MTGNSIRLELLSLLDVTMESDGICTDKIGFSFNKLSHSTKFEIPTEFIETFGSIDGKSTSAFLLSSSETYRMYLEASLNKEIETAECIEEK